MNSDEQKINLSGLLPDFHSLGVYPETVEQLSAQFVALLIAVAVLFLFISLLALFKANLRINWVRKLIKNETSQSVVMNRQELRDRAIKVKNNAGHLWMEFDETLIEAKVGNEYHLHNIYDASHFFNSSTLASGITESRMLAAVPGFLTALGVIGTFVGLQLGLSELNIGNDAAIQEMKAGLAHVISGAKIAFMTSVWGVTLSVLFNFSEKWFESFVRSRIHRLQVRIDELFPRFSAEIQLQKIAEDGAEARESLQGLAERIGEKMQESLIEATSGIQQGLEASLEKIMAPAINKLVNETADGSQKALEQLVEGFLDKFGEQGESQRQAMDAASKGVGDALSEVATLNRTHKLK
ncbi:anti-phage ZorAB system protein ZorA [Thiolapillus sp.]|uniref:anti-phage ZorAB system protein ZorA n=1 Tax=Thiolapillus sp. TaxID=2017437 RepID=UPI003AF7400E